jgi:hypothetical protein
VKTETGTNASRAVALVVAVAGLAVTAADAQTSLGAGAGVARPHGSGSQLWITANLRLPVGRRLAVEPEAAFWPGHTASRGPAADFKDVYLGGNVLVRFPAARVTAFAGAGGGVHRFDFPTGKTRLGLQVVAGVDIEASTTVSLFAAARREWIRLPPDDLWVTRAYGGVRLIP